MIINPNSKWRQQTRIIRSGTPRSDNNETSEPIYITSGYVYNSPEEAESKFLGEKEGYIYSRYGNPTVKSFEIKLSEIEGCEKSIATSSGMAAVNATLMSLLKSGDHIISSRALFGSCRYIIEEILPKFGIEVTFVDGTDLKQWQNAVNKNTVCGFFESPSNPMLEICDIENISKILHENNAKLVVDNAFCTSIIQKPINFGADIVVYSATKHIDGQGRCLGGAIMGSEDFVENTLRPYIRHTGPALSPFNAWVLNKGLETLEIRMNQHCINASKVADELVNNKKIKKIIFPGLPSHPQYDLIKKQMNNSGSIITLEINGDKKDTFNFLNNLELIDISNNLGDSKSLITHPSTTTHQKVSLLDKEKLGITDSVVRLSVGLEDINDILFDLSQSLQSI
ncbi:MAG: O-succinylhomoserine sulfhydrylase [Rhodospirillaceae bacterium]|nr:O-succinylhomoserine sulfhydrylase [Rhodospirillaceae bacterium]